MKTFKVTKESAKYELVGIIDITDVKPYIYERRTDNATICFDCVPHEALRLLVDAMNECFRGLGDPRWKAVREQQGKEYEPRDVHYEASFGNGHAWIHRQLDGVWEIDGNMMGLYLLIEDESWHLDTK